LHVMAYKLAEDRSIMLPVMVCVDGFILTHGVEVVDIPSQDMVDKFLPPYKAPYKLDIANPLTLGPLVDPEFYTETRFALNETHKEALMLIPKIAQEFSKAFGRNYNGLIEGYQIKDAERVIVAMGSVCGTVKEVVDELRKKGKKVGMLKIVSLRPFPTSQIFEALKNIPKVAVIDRALSIGSFAPLASEIKATFFGKSKKPKTIGSFIVGLGGRDVTKESIKEVFRLLTGKCNQDEFIDLKPELLKEAYE
jgi:pyruvate ferredoxin oxidoreductase alpha subunit